VEQIDVASNMIRLGSANPPATAGLRRRGHHRFDPHPAMVAAFLQLRGLTVSLSTAIIQHSFQQNLSSTR
jgi:hypothetical protein